MILSKEEAKELDENWFEILKFKADNKINSMQIAYLRWKQKQRTLL